MDKFSTVIIIFALVVSGCSSTSPITISESTPLPNVTKIPATLTPQISATVVPPSETVTPLSTSTPEPTMTPVIPYETDRDSAVLMQQLLKKMAEGQDDTLNEGVPGRFNIGFSRNEGMIETLFSILYRMDKPNGVPDWSLLDMSLQCPEGYCDFYYSGSLIGGSDQNPLTSIRGSGNGIIMFTKESIAALGDKALIIMFVDGKGFGGVNGYTDYYPAIVIGSHWDVAVGSHLKLKEFTSVDGLAKLTNTTAEIPVSKIGNVIIVDKKKYLTFDKFVEAYLAGFDEEKGFHPMFAFKRAAETLYFVAVEPESFAE